ncbi:MAG: hypothetical protein FWC97_01300 [Treponema sp.]|nr:hypothetical protein [Treponema sp.]
MKTKRNRKGKIVVVVLLALIIAIILCGCRWEHSNNRWPYSLLDRRFEIHGIDASLLRRIQHNSLVQLFGSCTCQADPDWFYPCFFFGLNYYFGTFNGYIVMGVDGNRQMSSYVTIAGFDFWFNNWPARIFTWNNGRVLDAMDAFERGFLTLENIKTMYEKHNRWRHCRIHPFGVSETSHDWYLVEKYWREQGK